VDPAFPWPELLAVWGFFLINVLTPGPNVFNTIGIALGSGRAAGLGAAAGVAPGVMLWGVAAVAGISALFRLHPGAQTAVTLTGAALLILFGARYLRRARAAHEGDLRARGGVSPRRAFAATLAVLATNPKALTTWILILSLFPAAETPLSARVALVLGMAAIATAVHVGYALAFSTRPAAVFYARNAGYVDAAVGLFFLTVGLRLAGETAGLL
jgi:threonine/homoserine/homoserine lactone efflux protein